MRSRRRFVRVLRASLFRWWRPLPFLTAVNIALQRHRVENNVKDFQHGQRARPEEESKGTADITLTTGEKVRVSQEKGGRKKSTFIKHSQVVTYVILILYSF